MELMEKYIERERKQKLFIYTWINVYGGCWMDGCAMAYHSFNEAPRNWNMVEKKRRFFKTNINIFLSLSLIALFLLLLFHQWIWYWEMFCVFKRMLIWKNIHVYMRVDKNKSSTNWAVSFWMMSILIAFDRQCGMLIYFILLLSQNCIEFDYLIENFRLLYNIENKIIIVDSHWINKFNLHFFSTLSSAFI